MRTTSYRNRSRKLRADLNQKRTASQSVDLKINLASKPVSTLLFDSRVCLHRDLYRQIVMDSGVRVDKAWKPGSRRNTRTW